MGTWIEMTYRDEDLTQNSVVPYVGTWIEISTSEKLFRTCKVVPYVGTWIEIKKAQQVNSILSCRSLRGNVDRNNLDYANFYTLS